MARTHATGLSAITGWTGRRAIRLGTYPLDLLLFIIYALSAWARRGHFHNRANRRAVVGHILLTGINPLPATVIVALAVGFVFALPLLPLGSNIDETKLATLLLRLFGLELGPLLAGVVVIGRAGSAMATELANMQLHGETTALERLGIDIRDFFIAPRLIAGGIAQVVLATYFTAIVMFGGMPLASLVVPGSPAALGGAVVDAVKPAYLAAFIGKNLLFGLLIAAAACYSALRVTETTDVPFRVQRALTASLILLFVTDGLLALLWL